MHKLGDIIPGGYFTVTDITAQPSDRLQLVGWHGSNPVARVLAHGYNGHLEYVIRTLSRDSQVIRLYWE